MHQQQLGTIQDCSRPSSSFKGLVNIFCICYSVCMLDLCSYALAFHQTSSSVTSSHRKLKHTDLVSSNFGPNFLMVLPFLLHRQGSHRRRLSLGLCYGLGGPAFRSWSRGCGRMSLSWRRRKGACLICLKRTTCWRLWTSKSWWWWSRWSRSHIAALNLWDNGWASHEVGMSWEVA